MMTTGTPAITIARLFLVFLSLCLIKDTISAPVKKESCSDGMDIAFILDASGSVHRRTWKKSLSICKRFVDAFDVSKDGTHFAIMTFSTKPKIEMTFNKYNGTDLNSAQIKRDIDRLRRQRGFTFIDRALIDANKKLFTIQAGMRQDKRKVAVVLTDGIQTMDRGHFTPLDIASTGLKSRNVEIFTLGIGSDIEVESLIEMASSEDHVYSARWISNDFDEFREAFCKSK